MPRNIFISYRRSDAEGEAGRLFDDLIGAFGEDSVFMDVSGIAPGVDFRQAIDENVSGCGVLLAMVGPTFATVKNNAGQRRLDDENDFVRLEIAAALRRNIAVIPVLVHEAKMPSPGELPEDIRNLAFHNSVEITHARWNSDVALLIAALQPYVATTRAGGTRPVHATVPVQLPAPYPPPPELPAVRRSRLPIIAGISIAAILAVIFVWVKLAQPPKNDSEAQPAAVPAGAPTQADSGSGTKRAASPERTPPHATPVSAPQVPPQTAGGGNPQTTGTIADTGQFAGIHHLTSMFMAPNNKCLESGDGSVPAKMNPCGNYSGQTWKIVPASNGYYRLQSLFMLPENKCLEGGDGQGAAQMNPCANVSGQLWRLEPAQTGYYRLKTMFMEPQNRCLESADGQSPSKMNPCANYSGQFWKMVDQ